MIVRAASKAHSLPMTWEEETLMDRLRQLFRARINTQADLEAQRRRSNRMRYFLTVFGAHHWAERVEGPSDPVRSRR